MATTDYNFQRPPVTYGPPLPSAGPVSSVYGPVQTATAPSGSITNLPSSSLPSTQASPTATPAAATSAAPSPATPAPTAAPQTATGSALQAPGFGSQQNFAQAFNKLVSVGLNMSDMTKQKNLLLTQLYNRPLNPTELKQLSPSALQAVQSNDKAMMEYQIMSINDVISGRQSENMRALGYLVQGYNLDLQEADKLRQEAEQKKQDSINNMITLAGKVDMSSMDPAAVQRILDGTATSQDAMQLSNLVRQQELASQNKTVTLPDGSVVMIDTQGNIISNVSQSATYQEQLSSANSVTDASTIADGIKTVESNGNYSAKGGSGEYGAYQFMPGTWDQWSQEYLQSTGQGGQSLDITNPANQDAVAQFKIQQWLNQGYSTDQIASLWNHGSPNYAGVVGTNAKGVHYDTPSYVKKVVQAVAGAGAGSETGGVLTSDPTGTAGADVISQATGMTPNGIWQAALDWALAGKSPSLGLGSKTQVASARYAIYNTAAAFAASMGTTVPALQAAYKANSSALTQMVKLQANVKQFEDTALANAKVVLAEATKVDSSGSPIWNKIYQNIQKGVTGSGDVAALQAAVMTFAAEYAKIMSGSTSASGSSVSSREDALMMINSYMSQGQISDVINVMTQDMNNRQQAIQDEVSSLTNSVSPGSAGTDQYVSYRNSLQPGEILVKDNQGNIGAIPTSEFDPSLYTQL